MLSLWTLLLLQEGSLAALGVTDNRIASAIKINRFWNRLERLLFILFSKNISFKAIIILLLHQSQHLGIFESRLLKTYVIDRNYMRDFSALGSWQESHVFFPRVSQEYFSLEKSSQSWTISFDIGSDITTKTLSRFHFFKVPSILWIIPFGRRRLGKQLFNFIP